MADLWDTTIADMGGSTLQGTGDPWDEVIKKQQKADPWEAVVAAQATPPAEESHPFIDTAKRIIPAIAGGLVGSLAGPWGTAAGGALGAGLGSAWAGDEAKQIALQTALGAIPAIGISKSVAPLARVGIRALEGAGMGGVGQVTSNLIEGQPLTESVLPAAGLGTALGTGGGLLEKALMGRQVARAGTPDTPALIKVPETGPTPEQAARLLALEAQQIKYKKKLDPMFDVPLADRPHKVTAQQVPGLIKLMRSDTEAAILELERLRAASPDPHRVPLRTAQLGANLAGVDVPERSFFKRFVDNLAPSDSTIKTTNPLVHVYKNLGVESSRAVEGLGVSGSELVKRTRFTYDNFENELSEALHGAKGFKDVAEIELKLTPQERRNLFDTGEGATAMNERVARVRDIMQAQQRAVEPRAARNEMTIRDPVTDKTIPWQPRQDFMPRFTDWDAVAKDPQRKIRAVAEIQEQMTKERGTSVSIGEAQEVFNRSRMNSRREYGHLEIARRFSLSDHERDGVTAHIRYMEGMLKRFNEAEQFGKKFEIAKNLTAAVGQETNDPAAQRMAEKYFEHATGKLIGGGEVDPALKAVSSTARGLQTGFKLSHAVISNMSQSVMTDMVVGHGNLVRGFASTMTKEGRSFGRLGGAVIEQTQRDMMGTTGQSRFASTILKYTGFNAVETFNRMLAANSGRAFAWDLAEKLQKGSQRGQEEVKRHLRTMGIEPMDIIRQGYKLTLDQELKAARSIIARTQFKIRPHELPLYWSGPLGSMVSQFSSFGFKAAKAIKDDLVKEAWVHGNFKPMARLLLVAPLVGEGVRDIQTVVKGNERPENMVARLADNMGGVGAFGIFADAYQSASHGELGVSRRILGPTISDLAGIAGAIGTGNVKQLAKTGFQNVPVVGARLRRHFFPPEE